MEGTGAQPASSTPLHPHVMHALIMVPSLLLVTHASGIILARSPFRCLCGESCWRCRDLASPSLEREA